MAYINRKQTEDAIRKYADQKHSNGEQIEYVNGILKAISVINEQPTADVEEVKHGEWKASVMGTGAPHCSLCNGVAPLRHIYCPRCGAKMDGRSDKK